ncbi:MAG: sigma-54-dependent Fis family transcriptional regulator [Deltaproteobacteria bacterium]|nr:sigma-54-dependent Fis family transcriptional regulator [Deltaproteobacteria bacterium]
MPLPQTSQTEQMIENNLNLLVIDDEKVIQDSLVGFLRDMGYPVIYAADGKEGLEIFKKNNVDIIITDLRMPGMDGLSVLKAAKELSGPVELIVMTAYGDMDSAIAAMRAGASDYILKPIKLKELIASLQRTGRYQNLKREKEFYRKKLKDVTTRHQEEFGLQNIIGESPAIRRVIDLTQKVWETDTTVFITGESGTGKELVAKAIHYGSKRKGHPFVGLNCASIHETLLESELYGHEKGAFTDAREMKKGHFELARGGTLFLDEIGDMSLQAQAKLLRSLEEKKIRRVGGQKEIDVDVRILSATNKNIKRLIEEDKFRKDLYYRLNVFQIEIPPLRERQSDIPLLADFFLKKFSRETGKEVVTVSEDALRILAAYPFYGNVRELKNLVERAVILSSGSKLLPKDFPSLNDSLNHSHPGLSEGSFELDNIEKDLIKKALYRANFSQVKAAGLLGISRYSLIRRLKKYNIGHG